MLLDCVTIFFNDLKPKDICDHFIFKFHSSIQLAQDHFLVYCYRISNLKTHLSRASYRWKSGNMSLIAALSFAMKL